MMSRAYSFLSDAGLSRVPHGGLTPNHAARKTRVAILGTMALLLAGCAQQSGGVGPQAQTPKGSQKIGVLLPLTGPNAGLGHELLAGAQLALTQPTPVASATTVSAPVPSAGLELDVRDTAAVGGATAAASAAIAAGDGILLGPLTAGDTAAAAPAALEAHVPVLAFTSDVTQARPGVWVMGITPEDQVQRLVSLAHKEGRTRFAALLPNTALGKALGNGLQAACQDNGLPTPTVIYHNGTTASITSMMHQLSAYDSRLAEAKALAGSAAPAVSADQTSDKPLPSDLAAALQTNGAAGTAEVPKLSAPPFDALLLGDTGLALRDVIAALNDAQVSSSSVRILGPGLWAAFATKLGALKGAWYAAPDPSSRQAFATQFMARNHHMPRPLADLSYDAAMVARTVGQSGATGYPLELFTRPEGFAGVDGRFTLQPNGQTRRALGVFEVIGNGSSAKLIAASNLKTGG
ncbi:MAG: penicillin-binding protein activator [Acetobacter orientalis]